jgi:DNA-binding GntR family transcriptional regulator
MPVDSISISGHHGAAPRRQQLPEEVAAYVRELIMSGAVRPGEFLRMDRIAEALRVSNTPVREGLLALSSQGFVRQIPRRGFMVSPFTQQDIRDLFWAQAVLAGELGARAAKNITQVRLARLDGIMMAHDAASASNDHPAIVNLGHGFHREINLAADSIRLAMLLSSVIRVLPLDFYSTIAGWVDDAHEEHPAIVDALRRKNASEAKKLMEQHIAHGAERLVETLEKRGIWSEIPEA